MLFLLVLVLVSCLFVRLIRPNPGILRTPCPSKGCWGLGAIICWSIMRFVSKKFFHQCLARTILSTLPIFLGLGPALYKYFVAQRLGSLKLYWCNFCSATDVTYQLHLHCSVAKIVSEPYHLHCIGTRSVPLRVKKCYAFLAGTESVPIGGAGSATEQCEQ